jgi:hypothetical protein
MPFLANIHLVLETVKVKDLPREDLIGGMSSSKCHSITNCVLINDARRRLLHDIKAPQIKISVILISIAYKVALAYFYFYFLLHLHLPPFCKCPRSNVMTSRRLPREKLS